MKFLISQELSQGKFFVKVILKEFSDVDQYKARVFGMPTLNVRHSDGIDYKIPINSVSNFPAFGFENQIQANDYATELKNEIKLLKSNWENLKDNWSKQEEI